MLPVADPQVVRFAEFELDLRSGELSANGRRVILPHQTFRLLAILVRERGMLVTREALRRELWSDDTFVEFEPGLNAAIRRLREALDDSAEHPRFIETLPRRGYRFIANVVEAAGDAFEEAALPARQPPGVPGRGQTRWRPPLVSIFFAIACVAALVLVVSRRPPRDDGRARAPLPPGIGRLTNIGTVQLASVSRDGRMLAYVRAENARQSLWLRSGDGTHRQLVPPQDGIVRSLAFGPGGGVYYSLFRADRTHVSLYRVSIGGGTPKSLPELAGRLAFSPDGSQFAHVSTSSLGAAESRVVLAGPEGGVRRVLAVRKPQASFARVTPAWSDDGRQLTIIASRADAADSFELLTISTVDGSELRRLAVPLEVIDDFVLLPDESAVISARVRRGAPLRLWHVSSSSPLRALTDDVSDYALAGRTPDGRLVAVRVDSARALWTGELRRLEEARQVASSSGSIQGLEGTGWPADAGVAWTPDGRVLYASAEEGNIDIWSIDPATGMRTRLTADPAADVYPSVSADGRTIAFSSDRGGTIASWIMTRDGDGVRRFTRDGYIRPALSPDGRWAIVQHQSISSVPSTLWHVRTDTGEAVRVGPSESIRPAVSPDGEYIAHYWMTPEHWTIAITPAMGAWPVRTIPVLPTHGRRILRWSPDGLSLALVNDIGGASNIWLQPVHGGPLRALTQLAGHRIAAFDWSQDGKRLAWTSISEVRDVVTIESGLLHRTVPGPTDGHRSPPLGGSR